MTRPLWLVTPSRIEAEAFQAGLPPILPAPYRFFHTGVGALATLHTLWQRWIAEEKPCGIIVVGIAGSFRRRWAPGTVVWVRSERWGDLGRRSSRAFQPSPPALREGFPLHWEAWPAALPFPFPAAQGLTLHSVSASPRQARFWKRVYPDADIETQENAAYFLFARTHQCPLLSFRIISNRVGFRQWDKEAALATLHTFARIHVAPLCEWLLAGDFAAGPR